MKRLLNDYLRASNAELLAALEAILSACDGEGWTLEELRACAASHARTAIAKAQP